MVRQRNEKLTPGGGAPSAVVGRSPGLALSRLARLIELALVPQQLSLSQYRVLGWLAQGSTASSILADKLAVTPPSITGLVDGLVARGFVERTPSVEDRRRQELTMTTAGKRAMAKADTAVEARIVEALSYLDQPEEIDAARRGLKVWEFALDRRLEARVQGIR